MKRIFAWGRALWLGLACLGGAWGWGQQAARADLSTGLLGQWHLDGGSLADASGNGRTMTATGVGGAPVSDPAGKVGGAYLFNCINSPVQVLTAPSINLSVATSITLTAWINPTTLQAGFTATSPHTVGRFYRASGGMDANLRIRDSKLEVFYANPANVNLVTTFTVPTNTWTFVAMTQSGTTLKIYANNLPPWTFTNTSAQVYDRLLIGAVANVAATGRGFEGKIDEIRAYSRALSDAEILSLYTSKIKVTPASLDFGARDVADGPTTQTITIENESGLPLDLSSISITGTNAAQFSQSVASGTAPVNQGAPLTLDVVFTPDAPGLNPRAAQLEIVHNDASSTSPLTVALDAISVPVELATFTLE